MHEDIEDDETTHEMDPPTLLPPVRSPDDLPAGNIKEGTLCLVTNEAQGTEQLWTFRDGAWAPAI
ncbi:MAG: hypothetical protein AAGA48_21165 [Myxococcota bacterium]